MNRQLRIFFALWPDTRTRARLAEVAGRISLSKRARRVPDYNLHLTLHFIGNVDERNAADMRRQAQAVQTATFELAIDHGGHFGSARVGWLGCSEVPDGLSRLHQHLGNELRVCGYQPEARAYRPHITVARKLEGPPAPIAFDAVTWKVDNFVLLESRSTDRGVKYQVVESYPLR